MTVELHIHPALRGGLIQRISPIVYRCLQRCAERLLHPTEQHPILWSLRPRKTWLHDGQIQTERIVEQRIRGRVSAKQPLLFAIALHQLHGRIRPRRALQVAQRFIIHREESYRRTILRRHVRYRRAIRERHAGKPFAEELDKLPDHALLPQHFRDCQHQVSGRRAFAQPPRQPEPHHFRHQEIHGLTQHRRFRFNAAHAPAHHAESVDHRRMAVRTHQAVRKCRAVAHSHHVGEIFEIDLVHDPHRGRHHAKSREGLLSPAQELVTLYISMKLQIGIDPQRLTRPERIHLHRVINDEINRNQRIDAPRVTTHALHRVAHRRQVHHRRYAGEILQQHPRGHERNLLVRYRLRTPGRHGFDVVFRDGKSVHVAQYALQQNANAERQPLHVRKPRARQRRQAVHG